MKVFDLHGDLEFWLHYANNTNYPSRTPAEGVVVRATDGATSQALGGKRLSFKVLSNKFLEAHGE